MTTAVILLAFAILPQDRDIQVRTCDVVEENHFYDNAGVAVLTQLIFWRGDMPVGWLLIGNGPYTVSDRSPPRQVRITYKYTGGILVVYYKSYIRTDTQYDVERAARDKFDGPGVNLLDVYSRFLGTMQYDWQTNFR